MTLQNRQGGVGRFGMLAAGESEDEDGVIWHDESVELAPAADTDDDFTFDDDDDEVPAENDDDGSELYDPGAHTVPEVLDYLADADDDERARVYAAEAAGANRTTLMEHAPS